MTASTNTDFDEWLTECFAANDAFTMLFVLLAIGNDTVRPLRAAYLHVMGDETRWPEMQRLLDSAGVAWSGVVFFRAGREGLVADGEAASRLAALSRKLHGDRTLIREGEFFNRDGLRLRLDEAKPH